MVTLNIPAEQDGIPAWPDKFSRAELDRMIEHDMGELRYAQQMLVRPFSLTGAELDIKWLQLYDYKEMVETGVLANPSYYWGVDPSISGKGDYLCICIVARCLSVDPLLRPDVPLIENSNKLFIVDFVREKANLRRTLEVFDYVRQMYPPQIARVEATAGQALLVQELQEKTTLPILAEYPKGNKEDRFRVAAQLYFGSGRTYIRGVFDPVRHELRMDEKMVPFQTEYMSFPRGEYDDTLDACASALAAASASGSAACVSVDPEPTAMDWKSARRNFWGI